MFYSKQKVVNFTKERTHKIVGKCPVWQDVCSSPFGSVGLGSWALGSPFSVMDRRHMRRRLSIGDTYTGRESQGEFKFRNTRLPLPSAGLAAGNARPGPPAGRCALRCSWCSRGCRSLPAALWVITEQPVTGKQPAAALYANRCLSSHLLLRPGLRDP